MAIRYYKLLDMLNRKKMSKEELRVAIGASSNTIAKIAKNDFVSLQTIDKICDILDCQPGDILEYERVSNL